MSSNLSRADVFTAQSNAEYTALAESNMGTLPPTLEELFKLLAGTAESGIQDRSRVLRFLIEQMQSPGIECPSIKLWLIWAFRKSLTVLSAKYVLHNRVFDEVYNDAVWCLLETLNSIDPQMPFLAKNINRLTSKRMRVQYGLEATITKPVVVPLQELRADGWDLEIAEASSFINDLHLAVADQQLLVGQYVYGYSQEELAEQLGISHAAIRQRMRRLHARIRAQKK